MHQTVDAVGVNQQPQVNYNQLRILYFVSFLCVVAFFVLNMFVGVLVESFHKTNLRLKQEIKASSRIKEELKQLVKSKEKKLLQSFTSRITNSIKKNRRRTFSLPLKLSRVRRFKLWLTWVVNHDGFQIFIIIIIVLNVLAMATTHYQMPEWLENALDVCNLVFTALFTIEALLKILAMTFKKYIADNWNKIDLIIVIVCIAGTVIDKAFVEQKIIPINPGIIRMIRVIRIMRGILLSNKKFALFCIF